MSETSKLGLPYLTASQSQKHVTVNESLSRLDGLTQLRLESLTTTTPPVAADEGLTYGVPVGGVNEWQGQDGNIAIYVNGGWVFVTPTDGWRAFVADQGGELIYVDGAWEQGVIARSPFGASMRFEVLEFDQTITAGASVTAASLTPSNSVVFGISGVVTSDITGTLTGWELGVSGATNRYGSGLGMATGSYLMGLTGQPQTYYSGLQPVLTATGGDFAGGTVRLAIHYMRLTIPTV